MKVVLEVGLIVAIVSGLAMAADVQINVRTAGPQTHPAVALDPAGSAVIAWSSYFTAPGRSNDILVRRLDAGGVLAGEESVVNVTGAGNQTEPAVAVNRRGDCVIVWQGPGLEDEDIFLRRFDASGGAISDDLLVNLNTPGRQLHPKVALSDAGTTVVVWESRVTEMDGDGIRACVRLLDGSGSRLGGEMILDDPLHDCRYPDVAMAPAGNFVVTWLRETGPDTVMARRFDPNGVPVADSFAVSTARITSLTRPAVAINTLGCFVIVWDGDPNRAGDDDIHGRLYDPNGTPRGTPFLVNTTRAGAQQWPQVALDDTGEFIIVWQDDTQDPNVATELFARRFDAEGRPAGEEFRLNTCVPDKQRYPDVAAAGGRFVAVWESNGQDGSANGIFAHVEPLDPNAVTEEKP
jgi:hypothetical protein